MTAPSLRSVDRPREVLLVADPLKAHQGLVEAQSQPGPRGDALSKGRRLGQRPAYGHRARPVGYPKVVGWDSGPRTDTELVLSALDNAVLSRDIRDGQLIHHSENGCQYTLVRFTQRLVDAGIARSTRGRRGQLR